MQPKAQTQGLTLCGEDIDRFLEWLDETQRTVGVDRRNGIRVRLLMEELLLRMRDHVGEGAPLSAACERRLGRARLVVHVEGDPFNPLSGVEPELGDWDSSLRTAIDLTPQYAYDARRNTLKLSLPSARMNPVMRIGVAVLLGITLGLAGGVLVPGALKTLVIEVMLGPAYDMWSRLLNAISGPIILLTVISTMLNTRSIDQRGGSSLVVILRYFVISLLVAVVALLCAMPLFGVGLSEAEMNRQLGRELLGALVQAVPANVIDPLVESNTSQLLCIALVLGYVLVQMGERTALLRQGVREANAVGLKLAEWMSLLVPPFSAVFLCLELWQGGAGVLETLCTPAVVSLAISLAMMAVAVVGLAQRLHVSPALVLRKLWPPFFKALKTGSLDASFAEAQDSCTQLFGIDPGYVKVGMPQGLVLYMPISAVGTIVFTLFVAGRYGVLGDPVWYASTVVMAVVVFVATPPVPGANLLAYVVLFQTLGLPTDALLEAMVFDVVFGIFAGAANQAMLQLEMVYQAHRIGLVSHDVLATPVRR